MVRILVILLSLAGMLTAFQNCGSGGTLTLERSNFSSSSFSKLLGSCNDAIAKLCDERWSANAADAAAVQSSCPALYQAGACPGSQLGVCESVLSNQLSKVYYYAGYDIVQAQASCKGTWQ